MPDSRPYADLPALPALPDFRPRLQGGVLEFPVHHMRGGTSTGLVLWERFAPAALPLREELLRHLMGVPLHGQDERNTQTTGLGRGIPTSNKVFFAKVDDTDEGGNLVSTLVSTLAQLAGTRAEIDWSVNCGNMSAALQLWAMDVGLVDVGLVNAGMVDAGLAGPIELRIRNTNTGVVTVSRMQTLAGGGLATADIAGVDGAYPAVDLFMLSPVGAKTGMLLPTGAVTDLIEGFTVSCVDVAVPMVICSAAQLGKTAHEPVRELENDAVFMDQLRRIRVAAGLRMGLRRTDGGLMTAAELERSETVPKICIVGAARGQGHPHGHLAVRYFTPQTAHGSMAVSGGCCLAAAALIPGSVAHGVAHSHALGLAVPGADFSDIAVAIEHPAGVLEATVVARLGEHGLEVRSAAYRRSAQLLLRGHVPLYRASPELISAVLARAAAGPGK